MAINQNVELWKCTSPLSFDVLKDISHIHESMLASNVGMPSASRSIVDVFEVEICLNTVLTHLPLHPSLGIPALLSVVLWTKVISLICCGGRQCR